MRFLCLLFFELEICAKMRFSMLFFPAMVSLWCAPVSGQEGSGGGGSAAGSEKEIVVRVSRQRLYLSEGGEVLKSYPCSTSRYGTGNRMGSNRTPLGRHAVKEKIGQGQPWGMRFVSRRPTGRTGPIYTDRTESEVDYVASRILWLEGLEPGVNRGGEVDSFRRYIYIHGTDEEGWIGTPRSHGCIRMKNSDVIDLFDRIEVGCPVRIEE